MASLIDMGDKTPRVDAQFLFNDFRFEEVSYAAGLHIPTHTHSQAFLDFCLSGACEEIWHRETFERGNATLNYLPIGAPHSSRFYKDSTFFQVVVPPAWIERTSETVRLADTLTCFRKGLPIWITGRIYREFIHRDNLSPLVLEGLLLELMAEVSRKEDSRTDSPRWLQEARDYLHVHCCQNISVDEISAAVNIHPSHLMREFRRRYHCTIGDYVRRLRVERACSLLSASTTSPSEIALDLGFADQSHFNRTFKAGTGMTPTEYRKLTGRASHKQEAQF